MAAKVLPSLERIVVMLKACGEEQSADLDFNKIQSLLEKCKSTIDILDALRESQTFKALRGNIDELVGGILQTIEDFQWGKFDFGALLEKCFSDGESSSLKLQLPEDELVESIKRFVCAGQSCAHWHFLLSDPSPLCG